MIVLLFGALAGALVGVVIAALVRQLVVPPPGSRRRLVVAAYSLVAILGTGAVGAAIGFYFLVGMGLCDHVDRERDRVGAADVAYVAVDAVGDHAWLARLQESRAVREILAVGAAEVQRAAVVRGAPGALEAAKGRIEATVKRHAAGLAALWAGALVVLALLTFAVAAGRPGEARPPDASA